MRIIDYKTGKFEKKEILVKDWEDLIDKPEMAKPFQLMFYAYLAKSSSDKPIQSGIVSFRMLSEGFMKVKTSEKLENLVEDDFHNFEMILKEILKEMFDKNVPFTQTGDIERCTYCPFTKICNKT